jgi:phage terminase large subunit-like protein
VSEHADIPHVLKAIEYAQDVVDGEVVACDLTRRACQRFLDDLNRKNAPWYFDGYKAEYACEFIETLPHIKGEWAKRRELLVLEPWQCFIVCNVFGWLFTETRLRRFRMAYIEVARKNAKSTLAAAISLYMLVEDGEAGAEIYSAATTRNQAKIVFSVAQAMAMRCPQLPIEVRAHNLSYMDQASRMEALHAQGETLDGHNIHCAINDELHAWKNRAVYDVIETATGSRQQPLIFNITTAGHDTNGICYEIRRYVCRILKGEVEDDSLFGLIYTLDDADDWTNREVWPKANPNWNVSVYPLDVENLYRKASEVMSQQNAFLTKRLNVWVNAAEAWMDMRKWEACRDGAMSLDDFAGEECFAGVDLASKIDVNSMCQLFSREINGEEHLFAFMRHWLPEAAVREDPNDQYDGWVRAGQMRTTPGNVVDIDQIENDTMEEVAAPFDLQELGVDPGHNSTQYGVHMMQEGLTVVDVRPTVLNFSEPMKWLEAYVKDGRFHHNCPVLTWMISNVEVKRDFKDNIYPRKSAVNRKIDGVIALLIALNRLKLAEDSGTVYDTRGVITL